MTERYDQPDESGLVVLALAVHDQERAYETYADNIMTSTMLEQMATDPDQSEPNPYSYQDKPGFLRMTPEAWASITKARAELLMVESELHEQLRLTLDRLRDPLDPLFIEPDMEHGS